jgi:hypothetical protein
MRQFEAKQYKLRGEFLPAQREGKVEWTPFVTIKTSGYEQWLGAQAANLCQPVIWDSEADLSSSLQTPARFLAIATGCSTATNGS